MRPYPDPTWFTPIYVILSSIEIDLAIICASIPIFWPIIEQSLAAIFVSYAVEIVEQCVEEHELTCKLEYTNTRESVRSSDASTEELIQALSSDTKAQYTVGVDPLDMEAQSRIGPQTQIHSRPKLKWHV